MQAIDSETIRRTRQRIQESYPELKADEKVLELRKQKEETGGNFVYQEKVDVSLNVLQSQLDGLRAKWINKVPDKLHPDYFKFRSDKCQAEKIKIEIENLNNVDKPLEESDLEKVTKQIFG